MILIILQHLKYTAGQVACSNLQELPCSLIRGQVVFYIPPFRVYHPFKLLLLLCPALSSYQSPSHTGIYLFYTSTFTEIGPWAQFPSIQRWPSPAAIKNPNLYHYPHNTLVRDNPTYSFTERVLRCMADWFTTQEFCGHSTYPKLWANALHTSPPKHICLRHCPEKWAPLSTDSQPWKPNTPPKCGAVS